MTTSRREAARDWIAARYGDLRCITTPGLAWEQVRLDFADHLDALTAQPTASGEALCQCCSDRSDPKSTCGCFACRFDRGEVRPACDEIGSAVHPPHGLTPRPAIPGEIEEDGIVLEDAPYKECRCEACNCARNYDRLRGGE